MTATLTNITGISLPLAVWLASDDYDFSSMGRKAISATAFLKPVRQILLRERLTSADREAPDVADFIALRLGHAIHDSIERAWLNHGASSLRKLGYPEHLLNKLQVNPEVPDPEGLQVWIEQRAEREIMGYTVSGKFDMVLDGILQDTKSTSVYSWMLGDKDDDYRKQGSIYRWLNPDKITANHMNIQFIFTDWSKAMSKSNPNYPQQRVKEHRVELMSIEQTVSWMKSKLLELEAAADLSEKAMPLCSDKELWRSAPVYKYYSDPTKTDGKATKNNDTLAEANLYMASKGGKGVVLAIPGKVKACSYCAAFPICTQKDLYDHG